MIQVEIGNLYVVGVPPDELPTQIPAVPDLYNKFDANNYILLPGEKTGKRELYMLGCVEVTSTTGFETCRPLRRSLRRK